MFKYFLGQVKATDLDQGENARIYYYLVSNISVPFIVDRLDGTIYANDTLDREKQSSYQIIVKASNDISYQQKNVTILCTYILIISLGSWPISFQSILLCIYLTKSINYINNIINLFIILFP